MAEIYLAFSLACAVSFCTGALVVFTAKWHSRWSADHPGSGPQKLHLSPIPRIGGLAVAAGLFVSLVDIKFATVLGERLPSPIGVIVALSVPLLVGLWEDLTRLVGPWLRLIATFIAAGIAYVYCGAAVVRFDMPFLDVMLAALPLAPFFLTLFCVGGVAHAFNLSDGLNGLLGGLATVGAVLIGAVAMRHGDMYVAVFSAALAGATIGFLFWNFPKARVFAGDSGAYLLGTAISLLAIWLAARNANVTPWLAFIAVLYPFTDTTFAILRRALQRRPIMSPDAEHLHSLLARVLSRSFGLKANAMAAAGIVAVAATFAWFAYFFASSAHHLIALCVLFAVLYSLIWFALMAQCGAVSEEESAPSARGL
ncbi:MAG: undecaprenyl/decaprenyl-phosphate alpha-N-acetylglucosaminyl 1-phosphate transferase [Burkholderiales bacterium]|nr:MAG: undecaprenyl/decaprenyl-phosphate alpha-N-acetylglucosaminyl 1-phosphate transferase [Burkholderiales bacterium]TAG79734.1 MAG: undecaprenyl/decaprenyl-phosphate alpha-N-acetylglucosaminyl 1-phosphate transferase [Betaproteobacteria bacterium]